MHSVSFDWGNSGMFRLQKRFGPNIVWDNLVNQQQPSYVWILRVYVTSICIWLVVKALQIYIYIILAKSPDIFRILYLEIWNVYCDMAIQACGKCRVHKKFNRQTNGYIVRTMFALQHQFDNLLVDGIHVSKLVYTQNKKTLTTEITHLQRCIAAHRLPCWQSCFHCQRSLRRWKVHIVGWGSWNNSASDSFVHKTRVLAVLCRYHFLLQQA